MDSGVVTYLLSEATALGGLFTVRGLGPLALTLAGVWLGQAVLRWLVQRLVRADRHADTAERVRLAIRLLASILAGLAVLHHVGRAAPLLVATAAVVVVLGLGLGLGVQARAWLAGWALILGSRLRVGDRVRLDGHAGTLEEIGLLRLALRGDDGARVVLPARSLAGQAVSISTPERSSVALDLRLHVGASPSAPTLRRVRVLAALCPYRTWAPAPVVSAGDDHVRVQLHAWSPTAAEAAEAYLREATEAT